MMASIYFHPCRRKDMKKSTYLLSIILLSSSISGCTGEIDEATGEDEKGGTIIVTHDVMYSDARLDVSQGEENYEILLRLNHTAAPNHADNFRSHILKGNYDGVDFHRIIDDFMIQGGDFENRDGTGGFAANWYGWCNGVPIPIGECSEENYTVPDEVDNRLSHYSCTISMAHAGSNTGGSQFFLIPGDVLHLHWLDGVHTVFGDVVGGCDYVTTLSGTETNNDRPIVPVTISSAEVSEVYIEQVETRLEAGADLRGADLSYANMSNLNLTGANLKAANLNYTMLQGADLRYADLRYTWLTGADLTGADLRQAGLHVAWLNGANLTGADLTGANLTGANLYDANLTGADLIYAYLRYAILYDANLNSADLSGANLTYATLTGADLSGANLNYADLTGANLTNATLTGADLSGTIWYGTICPDGANSDDNGNTCENNKNHVQERLEVDTRDSGPINIPPCSKIASEGLNQTSNPSEWPEIRNGQWLAIDGLTNVSYASIEFDNDSDVVVDYRLDWMCGYTYSVKIPGGYNASNEYPVFLYLHGQIEDSVFFNNMLTNNFHIPEDDKYIIVRPSKLELDWDPKKALDVLEDVKSHLSVDDDRVYLTGLSMGGRGTFIVAAALPEYFAAIMPLSPHHEPYSYLSLAEDVAHLPIWMSHGTEDNTSSFEMAEQMAANLADLGAEIEFHPVVDGGHNIWFPIYSDPSAMQWMLSHVRGQ